MSKKFDVTGMSCAACSARIEKAVGAVDGVDSVSVNLLTNSMAVSGNVDDEVIMKAVEDAGYSAAPKDGSAPRENSKNTLKDEETPKLVKRLVVSVVLLLPLMYVSMGHMMWGWKLPAFLDGNYLGQALFQLIFTIAVMVVNQRFFISGFKALFNRSPNMDTLVSLGSGAAFVYSVVIMFLMTIELTNGNINAAHDYMHGNFYFESSAMILTLITVGKTLEAYSKGKTTNALKSLMSLAPDTATVIRNGEIKTVKADEVTVGDTFVVKAGESIPVDGVIIKGECAVDESALTGESIPVDKTEGDRVSAATISKSGYIECRATSVGQDTTLSKIIQMVADASSSKAPIAKIADKVSGIFVPTVIVISLVTMICWLIAGESIGFVLARGISVLVISCPCALGLATPVAIMVGSGKGARNGILFKTAESLEVCGKSDIVCFDKTGTITEGEPVLTDIKSENTDELLKYAFSLESKSEHPLSKAIVKYCSENNIELAECSNVKTVAGNGLQGVTENKAVFAGNEAYISQFCKIPDEYKEYALKLSKLGKTPLYFCVEDCFLGVIAVADTVKENSKTAVSALEKMGVRTVMITGDNYETANAIADEVGIGNVIAKVLPQGKEETVRTLSEYGTVAMVGDGINDAPALTRAQTGIAVGAGTDVAIDAADVVLMKSDPMDIPKAVNLSRKVLRNIKENLFWAFIYNIIGIPVAAGVLYPFFGITLNPMIAAAAMSISSFCVVTNALRLNLVKIDNFNHKNYRIGELNMSLFKKSGSKKPYIEIEGMMCEHCEKHVTEALSKIGLTVEADHKNAKAYIKGGEASDEMIEKAVNDAGYKYIKTVR